MLVRIGLLFETDILVSSVETKAKKTSHQPFGNVNQVKWKYQQFQLLLQMYSLMIDKDNIFFKLIILKNNKWPDWKAYVVFIEKMFKD